MTEKSKAEHKLPRSPIIARGTGFLTLRRVGPADIAPYCGLTATNPLEGGRLPSDPWITLTKPKERS